MRRTLLALLAMALGLGTSLTAPSAAGAATCVPVGVIPYDRSCPAGSEAITIRMDNEDDGSNNWYDVEPQYANVALQIVGDGPKHHPQDLAGPVVSGA